MNYTYRMSLPEDNYIYRLSDTSEFFGIAEEDITPMIDVEDEFPPEQI